MNRLTMALAAAAVGGVGLLPGTAHASNARVQVSSWGGSGHSACSSCDHGVAGVISIDGRRTTVRAGHGVNEQLVHAFRRAGYRASCERGRVVVRFGYCRPSVRWSGDGYGTSFSWEGDCLSIRTFRNHCGSCHGVAPSKPVIRIDWGPRYHERPHWDSRPGWNHRRPGHRRPGRC